MARPATAPLLPSTDTNFSTGPAVGTVTKVAPSGGQVAEGFAIPGRKGVSQWWNYLFNNWGLWFAFWLAAKTKAINLGTPMIARDTGNLTDESQFKHFLGTDGTGAAAYVWQATVDSGQIFFPLDLPPDASLVSISVRGKNSNGSFPIQFSLASWDQDSVENLVVVALTAFTAATTVQTKTVTPGSPVAIDPTKMYGIRILAGKSTDKLLGISVTYTP